jgi:hypothetical protein
MRSGKQKPADAGFFFVGASIQAPGLRGSVSDDAVHCFVVVGSSVEVGSKAGVDVVVGVGQRADAGGVGLGASGGQVTQAFEECGTPTTQHMRATGFFGDAGDIHIQRGHDSYSVFELLWAALVMPLN